MVKKNVRKTVYKLIVIITHIISAFYKLKNFKKAKVFVSVQGGGNKTLSLLKCSIKKRMV